MILDVEKGFKQYFVSKMEEIVGNGNFSVDIHNYIFPDNSGHTGISIFDENPTNHNAQRIYPTSIRIHCRSNRKATAFTLMQNTDLLIDKRMVEDLNADLKLLRCSRNAGPSYFKGDDGLHYYTVLYDVEVGLKDV